MCGVVGFIDKRDGVEAGQLTRMADRLRHRGPDDGGVWIEPEVGLGLGHRRLSIVDLSQAGHQPMTSACGRYVIVYNGEIYNHRNIRDELAASGDLVDWRGHSDTETLLSAFSKWGPEATLSRLNGMFAFAVWDKKERVLILARDRLGEKPLYYGQSEGVFLFGSELKALISHPKWNASLDRTALTQYLRHSYIPSPYTIYKKIQKLPPAHYLVVSADGIPIGNPRCFWNLREIAGEPTPTGTAFVGRELSDELEALLSDSVKMRMMSDVPLGVFLSGGYDSTIVTALLQIHSSVPAKTFSVGFDDRTFNEAQHAKAVAKYLGTEHTELYVTAADAIQVIPKLPTIYDEPFADSSQIPTYLVSELARRSQVTVCLSGDGGDELFCGYSRYHRGHDIWKALSGLPPIGRRTLAFVLRQAPGRYLDHLASVLPARFRPRNLGDRLPKLADTLASSEGAEFYRRLISHWNEPEKVVLGGREPDSTEDKVLADVDDFRHWMMLKDALGYLPDDILTKVDRASMAVSLETRIPLLDHRIVEFSWRVPIAFKYREGQSKWLLRQVLHRYVPPALMERPKMGFGVPIGDWLRGQLRDWAEDLLDERKLQQQGYLDPKAVRAAWNEHLSGRREWHYRIWTILMFQAWLEEHR